MLSLSSRCFSRASSTPSTRRMPCISSFRSELIWRSQWASRLSIRLFTPSSCRLFTKMPTRTVIVGIATVSRSLLDSSISQFSLLFRIFSQSVFRLLTAARARPLPSFSYLARNYPMARIRNVCRWPPDIAMIAGQPSPAPTCACRAASLASCSVLRLLACFGAATPTRISAGRQLNQARTTIIRMRSPNTSKPWLSSPVRPKL